MKILISGLKGFMGKELYALCEKGVRGAEAAGGVDINADGSEPVACSKTFADAAPADCIIDFSHHSATVALFARALETKCPVVLATTGQTPEERAVIEAAAKEIPVFFAANFSLGIALLIELAKQAAAAMPEAEIEIVEAHHDRKLDAPSGTALAIFEGIKEVRPAATANLGRSGYGKRTPEEIGIHAVRMGNITGIHEVIIGTANQTVTLKHEAHSRALFAEGALAAAQFLIGKPAGLYDMKSLLA